MGKYDTESHFLPDIEKSLQNIANEIAEVNRLKRLEMLNMEAPMITDYTLEELEDQA